MSSCVLAQCLTTIFKAATQSLRVWGKNPTLCHADSVFHLKSNVCESRDYYYLSSWQLFHYFFFFFRLDWWQFIDQRMRNISPVYKK